MFCRGTGGPAGGHSDPPRQTHSAKPNRSNWKTIKGEPIFISAQIWHSQQDRTERTIRLYQTTLISLHDFYSFHWNAFQQIRLIVILIWSPVLNHGCKHFFCLHLNNAARQRMYLWSRGECQILSIDPPSLVLPPTLVSWLDYRWTWAKLLDQVKILNAKPLKEDFNFNIQNVKMISIWKRWFWV